MSGTNNPDNKLRNLHHALQLNPEDQPEMRVASRITNTDPIPVSVDTVTIQGDVNVDKVRIWDGTNLLLMEQPNNDGEPSTTWSIGTESFNMMYNGTSWDRMRGTIADGVLVNVSNDTLTVDGTVNIGTIPEVEVKNDAGNPLAISKDNAANSVSNPIYVAGAGGTTNIGNFPEAYVTAFEEPLAVTITPVQQAEAVYGLDPDFWIQSVRNGGSISTSNSTWQVQSGTSAGGYARLATQNYVSYPPGQGIMFRWTAAFTANGTTRNAYGVDNIVQNTGPIDREDGYSIGYSGSTASNAERKIGILHRRSGKAEIRELTITTAPTGTQTATITLDGVAYSVTITNSTSVSYTATQIATLLKANTTFINTWDVDACGGKITFIYYSPGARNGTYSFSSTGSGTIAVGTFAQIQAGAAPTDTWTYVDSWNGTVPNFDPTKLNVWAMDMRWLGAGRVRFFMEDPTTGKMVLIHTQIYSSTQLTPHVLKPAMRVAYRCGTTNPAITPSQNVTVTGASIFGGIQGNIVQTSGSQAYYNTDSTNRSQNVVHHLLSIQNPVVRSNMVNKNSLIIQDLTVSAQGNDPSVLFIVKNAVGTSDYLVFNPLPGAGPFNFAQFSISNVTETLSLDQINNIQTLGVNSSNKFDLLPYNMILAPGDYVSVFLLSTSTISRTAVGMTWRVD